MPAPVRLVLYVSAGDPARGGEARRNLESVLARASEGSFQLEVKDIESSALDAERDRVDFTPVLMKGSPDPVRVLGTLRDRQVLELFLERCGVEISEPRP